MTGRPRHPDAGDDTAARRDRESPPPAPRWVWVFAVVVGVLIVLAVIVMLVGGGQHGPARHTSAVDTSVSTATDVDDLPLLASAHG